MRRLALLVVAEAAAIASLAATHGPLVERSLPLDRPDDGVVLGLWVLGAATVGWLAGSTLACLVVALVPVPRAAHRGVAALAPRAIRIAVTRGIALSLATSLAAASVALAAEDTSGVRTGREDPGAPVDAPEPGHDRFGDDGGPDDTSPPEDHEAPEGDAGPEGDGAPDGTGTGRPSSPSRTVPHDARIEYRVAPGDHLWSIAAARLGSLGLEPTDAEIAPYWARLVEENRHHLRSGDPDLIYPGEVVLLPPR